jgi:hypothetical protein
MRSWMDTKVALGLWDKRETSVTAGSQTPDLQVHSLFSGTATLSRVSHWIVLTF